LFYYTGQRGSSDRRKVTKEKMIDFRSIVTKVWLKHTFIGLILEIK